jgi:cell division protein FtsB
MIRRRKILIFVLLIILLLILYLILTSESVVEPLNLGQQIKTAKTALLEADYEVKAKEFLAAYEKLVQNHELTSAQAKKLKDQLLNLKVPAKFKISHVNFVLALSKLEDDLGGKVEQGQNLGQQLINQLKADYGWLNR